MYKQDPKSSAKRPRLGPSHKNAKGGPGKSCSHERSANHTPKELRKSHSSKRHVPAGSTRGRQCTAGCSA